MASDLTIRSTGFKEADRIFRGLKSDVKEKELRKIWRFVGRILVKEERQAWNRVVKTTTGATAASIGTLIEKRGNGVGAIAVGPVVRSNRARSGWKAIFFEFGTKFMTMRPFVRPSISRKKKEMEDTGTKRFKRKIETTMKRFRKR